MIKILKLIFVLMLGGIIISCQGEVDKRSQAEIHRDKYGSIFGAGGIEENVILDKQLEKNDNKKGGAHFGADINYYIWKASLEFANRHGIDEMDTISGYISTFWRKSKSKGMDIKISFFVKSPELALNSLDIKTYTRTVENRKYVVKEAEEDINISIKNNILDRANKLFKAEQD